MTTIPPRPATDDEIPSFTSAKRIAPRVMKHYGWTSLKTWVMYANDEIGVHVFNRNGSHRALTQKEMGQ